MLLAFNHLRSRVPVAVFRLATTKIILALLALVQQDELGRNSYSSAQSPRNTGHNQPVTNAFGQNIKKTKQYFYCLFYMGVLS